MIRNKYILKFTSVLCVLLTINNVVFPTLSYALTSGPTAPEATSFEPVDTTDMVDLLTGDFTYSMPLLEVPGPAGGYPLSLSYHAGIQPNEDASWVGLGWTLNPGAINRSVNGYPDDYQNVSNMNRYFWKGGETTTWTVGVSVGVAEAASVSAGLSFSNDTFRGRGVGAYAGGSVGFGASDSPGFIGISGQIGVTPYGDPYASAGVGVGIGTSAQESMNIGINVGVQANTLSGISASAGGGISYRGAANEKGRAYNASLLGASISTGGTKPSLSVGGGYSAVHNNQSNNISSYSNTIGGDIPVYPGISVRIARSYQRYWIDETVDVGTFGALYLPNSGYQVSDVKAFDTYDLAEKDGLDIEETEPVKTLGGSFPDYDSYQVLAQGVAGSIKPYHFQKNLSRQYRTTTVKTEREIKGGGIFGDIARSVVETFPTLVEGEITVPSIESVPLGFADNKPSFRFVNDFSNRYEYESGDFQVDVNNPGNYLSFAYDNDIITGETGNDGYNTQNNQLASSKHVVHYTNAEILRQTNKNPFSEGFVDTKAAGFLRENNTQIGGFMVTNESGITYHFALPAYSYDEYIKSENAKAEVETFNEFKKPEKYAYTWYLTAVTGPDYVDRGNVGLDKSDWGYWVSFEYGQWTDGYQWRNPGEGINKDVDEEFENFSYGKKELYYLDAIRTATHTALFVKQMRKDGKSVTSKETGGYNVKHKTETTSSGSGYTTCNEVYYPTSVLGLKSIYLFKNETLSTNETTEILRRKGEEKPFIYSIKCDIMPLIGGSVTIDVPRKVPHYADNVIDETDITSSKLSEKALRIIDLSTSYSLCANTSNSINNENLYQEDYQEVLSGKYTLEGITFLGKAGKQVIPSTTFSYDKNPDYDKDKYDVWGFYKSDYSSALQDDTNENVSRMTSEISADDVDAWSLSRVKTPLGADIHIAYASDRYDQVVAGGEHILRIKDVVADQGLDKLKVTFWDEADALNRVYEREDQIDIDFFGAYQLAQSTRSCDLSGGTGTRNTNNRERSEPTESNCVSNAAYDEKNYVHKAYSGKVRVAQVDNDHIIVESEDLYNQFITEQIDVADQRFYFSQRKPSFVIGGIARIPQRERTGGGIRVQSLSIEAGGKTYTTSYEYTGGTTTYEPFRILAPALNPDYFAQEPEPYHPYRRGNYFTAKTRRSVKEDIEWQYKSIVLNTYKDILSVARELPGPGVMYEYVTVKEQRKDTSGKIYALPNYSTYQFEMYKDGMVSINYEATQNKTADGSSVPGAYIPSGRERVARGPGRSRIPGDVEYTPADGTREFSVRTIKTRKVNLQDQSTRVGTLKAITLFDQNGKKVSETVNHFLNEEEDYLSLLEEKFFNQGKIVESFADARKVFAEESRTSRRQGQAHNLYDLLGVITQRKTYPVVPTGQTTVNYKTGITTTSRNLTFDYFSGDVISTLSQDSYGNYYLSNTEPAYWFYDGMGLKTDDLENKNMLSQQASNMIYKVDKRVDGPVYSEDDLQITGLVSSTAQTWSNQTDVIDREGNVFGQADIWRKQASYRWNGKAALQHDGTYPTVGNGAFSAFDFRNVANNTPWEQVGAITLYDINSHALEGQDINGNYAATRLDADLYKVIASAANASYQEFAYSGAEQLTGRSEEGGVGVTLVAGEVGVSNAFAHTGENSLLVNTGQKGFSATITNNEFSSLDKPYFASVWVYLPGKSETETEMAKVRLSAYGDDGRRIATVVPRYQQQKSKSWYLLNLVIDPKSNQQIRVVCENGAERGVYFDDFRLHPLEASMSSFVYDAHTDELTYILDADNLYTHFEYDAQGRLIRSSRERLNFDFGQGKRSFRADQKLQQIHYNYAETDQ